MRTIVVGDVHGCLEELQELLRVCHYHSLKDRLVFLGDLIDRGPFPLGVIEFVSALNVPCVMGNHEEKAIRWKNHELRRRYDPSYKNPMRVSLERAREWASFPPDSWAFLELLPFKVRLGGGWAAVHAGVRGGLSLNEQFPYEMLRLRYLRKSDRGMAHLSEKITAETHDHWTELWAGPESIVYGHQVYQDGPHIMKRRVAGDKWVWTVGIDTGCCYGGHLTAMLMTISDRDPEAAPDIDFCSVPARKKYVSWREPLE